MWRFQNLIMLRFDNIKISKLEDLKILTLEDFDISRSLNLKMFRFCVLETIFGAFWLVCCVVSHTICNFELISNNKPLVLELFGFLGSTAWLRESREAFRSLESPRRSSGSARLREPELRAGRSRPRARRPKAIPRCWSTWSSLWGIFLIVYQWEVNKSTASQ